ncbi:MAG: HAMP domain-containing histidine kinase [Gemmatimonadetes bacterium]|nr:HAMP domain-containing histidine kinase [Gemmatimonadota bacterium]
MRTTRHPRSSRRHHAAEPFGAAALAVAAREILQARLLLLAHHTPQPLAAPARPAPRWTLVAADPVLRRVLHASGQGIGLPIASVAAPQRGGDAPVRDRSVAKEHMRIAEELAVVRLEALQRRSRLLASVRDLLDVSPDALAAGVPDVLSRLGCLLVPALADYVRMDLLREDGALEGGAVVHNLPARCDGWMPDGAPVLAERVARGEAAAVVREGETMPAGFRAFACVPLRARGRTLGVMTLGTTGAAPGLDDDDVRLAEDVARSTAVALDNARLFARGQAEARCREQALATVSHEMRGPLQVISIASGALLRAWPADASLAPERRQLAVIADSADRMRRLTADLLDLSRDDVGHFSVSPEPVRVDALLRGAVDVYGALAERKGITLTVSPSSAPAALADEPRVHQVLANLITNAVRHTPAGGAITVSAQAEDGQVRFSVADSGAGIAPENLPRVFDRFWSADKCRGCAGLGLAISRAIVQAHGGAMSVDSQPGQGATFTFTLPLAGA